MTVAFRATLAAAATHSAGQQGNASGFPMDTGEYSGFTHVFASDFGTDVAEGGFATKTGDLGTWPTATDDLYMGYYPDDYDDTSNNGLYNANKTMSIAGSVLTVRMHTEAGQAYVGAPVISGTSGSPWSGQVYGRYSVAMRHRHVSGTWDDSFKIAFLLWPTSDVWPDDGETDFPETNLQAGSSAGAFMHYARAAGGQDVFHADPGDLIGDWHVYTIEWTAGQVTFLVDGVSIGTSTNFVPSGEMRWVLQCETELSGSPTADSVESIDIDWLSQWAYTGG